MKLHNCFSGFVRFVHLLWPRSRWSVREYQSSSPSPVYSCLLVEGLCSLVYACKIQRIDMSDSIGFH